ncbi:concanavalin A-like lectin/glucanase domain-containing protein [Podospora didyma]|uniref:chitinase n=1 Tax=Podospora didyma TaxID=330526 RepID=A0AAE0KAP4_9PEZI|nr:concanavalin A-like lectin/glucanase domain-containing protein [Podospora didyma]
MLPPRSFLSSAVALLASSSLLQNVAAQVTTDCFPMNKTCPPDPALSMAFNFNFNQTPKTGTWDTTVGPVKYDAATGAAFTINKQGDSPTIRSKFYFFWGRTEIWMKAAHGTGVISSIMFLSDNLDEIDWEFFGGNQTDAQSNYFGKGEPDFHNAGHHPVPAGVQNDYHNYTTMWTKDALDFYIDGQKVRTLLPKDANNTRNYPQTPMRLSIGIWAGGDPSLPQGTRDWAGGTTDYKKGPFTMYVKSVNIEDFSSGKEYVYSDRSGSWQSIKVVQGNSTVKAAITAPPEEPSPSISDKWNGLSPTAKTAIYASAAGVGALILGWALFYCIRQRRRGAREARLAEARAQEERAELERFKKSGVDPDSFAHTETEYNAKDMRRDGLSDSNSYSVPTTPMNEKWETAAAVGAGAGAGAAAAGAMRSPMPLLRNGSQSPRVTSPGSAHSPFNAPYSDRAANMSPASFANPRDNTRSPVTPLVNIRSPAPGMGGPPNQFSQQANRSFSSPTAQMRVASPGAQQPSLPRMTSPAPMAAPQPQRSFTTGGYSAQQPQHQPQPQRSFTSGGYGGQQPQPQPQRVFTNGGYGGQQPSQFPSHQPSGPQPGNGAYGGGYGNGNGGNNGYWNNGGYR